MPTWKNICQKLWPFFSKEGIMTIVNSGMLKLDQRSLKPCSSTHSSFHGLDSFPPWSSQKSSKNWTVDTHTKPKKLLWLLLDISTLVVITLFTSSIQDYWILLISLWCTVWACQCCSHSLSSTTGSNMLLRELLLPITWRHLLLLMINWQSTASKSSDLHQCFSFWMVLGCSVTSKFSKMFGHSFQMHLTLWDRIIQLLSKSTGLHQSCSLLYLLLVFTQFNWF